MKTRFAFRTFVLVTVAPLLLLLTGLWAAEVYRSTHRIILDGFDRKLLAVAQGTAALTDGDAHLAYQRRRVLIAFAPLSPTTFAAFDPAADELVVVDKMTGNARRLGSGPAAGIRALAAAGDPPRLVGLSSDGSTLIVFSGGGAAVATVALAGRLDGLFADGGGYAGWNSRDVFQVDVSTGQLARLPGKLPDSMLAVTTDPATRRRYGLTIERTELVQFEPDNRLVRRAALHGDDAGQVLHALAFVDGELFALGDSVCRVNPRDGVVTAEGYQPGYFNLQDPFYQRFRAAYAYLQTQARLTYLYTQVYLGNDRIYYVMDGSAGPGYSPPGTVDVLPATSREGAERVHYVGRPWVSPVQQWQVWGLLKSGFAPIRDYTGKVVAMTGADVDIGLIRQRTRWAMTGAIVVGLCSLAAAGLVSFRVSAALTRPLRSLKETALRIAAGNYAARADAGGGREIAVLAERLDDLRGRLQREQQQASAWQEELQGHRWRAALLRALDAEALRLGLGGDSHGAQGQCDLTGAVLWWFGPAVSAPEPVRLSGDDDAVASACLRVRLLVLAHALRHSGCVVDELLVRLAPSFPTLDGFAGWEERDATLHYWLRRGKVAEVDGVRREFVGRGALRCAAGGALRWADVPAAAACVRVSPSEPKGAGP